MLRNHKKPLAIGLLGLFVVGFAMPSTAEARRYRRAVRIATPRAVVVAPVRRAPVYVAPVRRRAVVRAPYVGVGVGYRGVGVVAPGVGIAIGF